MYCLSSYYNKILLSISFTVAGFVLIGLLLFRKYYCKNHSYQVICKFLNNKLYYYFFQLLLIFSILFIILMVLRFEKKHETRQLYSKLHKNREVFVYDNFQNKVIPILITADKKYLVDLLAFHLDMNEYKRKGILLMPKKSKEDSLKESYWIKLPPTSTLTGCFTYSTGKEPLGYLEGYTGPDDQVAVIVDFDTVCWGYIRYYVHKNYIHYKPAKELAPGQRKKNIVRDKVSYGLQCLW